MSTFALDSSINFRQSQEANFGEDVSQRRAGYSPVEPEVIDLFKQFYGWCYYQYLRIRWRRLRRMTADEYVEAVRRGRIDGSPERKAGK